MILSVHAIFGASVASLVPNHPIMAFSLGFLGHFALDAIPHKDYELISVDSNSNSTEKKIIIDSLYKKFRFIRDVVLVSFDALMGSFLAFLFFFNPIHPWIFLIGAIGSLIPDFLTFLYLIIKHKPLILFFDFHSSIIHSKRILKLSQPAGVFLQFCTVGVIIAIILGVKWFLSL